MSWESVRGNPNGSDFYITNEDMTLLLYTSRRVSAVFDRWMRKRENDEKEEEYPMIEEEED